MPLFLLIILGLIVGLGAAWLFLIAPRLFARPDARDFVRYDYAHRGWHGGAQKIEENTLPAFREAAARGFGIELDVRLTRDGIPVVFHDSTLLRLFGRDVRVSDLSYRELSVYRFPSGEGVPTFAQVLASVSGRVPLLIELKTERDTTRLCQTVCSLLDRYTGFYAVESFDPFVLHWFRKNRAQVLRGQLLTHFQKADSPLPRPVLWAAENLLSGFLTRPDFVAYNWKYRRNLSLRMAKKLFGLIECNWTVQDMDTYNQLKQDGVVCIFEGFDPRQKR